MTENSSWPKVAFADVVHLNTDRVADPAAAGIERYVGIEHITPEDLRVRRWGLVAEGTTFTNYFRPGQVLFPKRRAYQHKVAVADFEGVCSGDIYVFESRDPAVLLPELLPFICQTDAFFDHAIGTSAGSLSPRTNWSHLAAYEFPLPPPDEQRRLVEVLNASSTAKETSQQLVQSSANVVNAFCRDLLNEHVSDYPSVELSKLATRITVGIVVQPAKWYVSGNEGVPALRSLNVSGGRLVFDNLVYISKEGHEIHEKSKLLPGDVVIVRSGRPGDAAVIPDGIGPLNCIDLVITTPNETLLSEYLVAYLNSPLGRQTFLAGTVGTAQAHFNVGAIKKMCIPCPPLSIQELFVGELNSLVTARIRIEDRRFETDRLHSGLVARLVGE